MRALTSLLLATTLLLTSTPAQAGADWKTRISADRATVSYEAVIETAMVLMFGVGVAKGTSVDPLEAVKCQDLSAPIGKVDIEISLYMTGEGFQMSLLDSSTGKTHQEAQTWEEYFSDK